MTPNADRRVPQGALEHQLGHGLDRAARVRLTPPRKKLVDHGDRVRGSWPLRSTLGSSSSVKELNPHLISSSSEKELHA
jgi:hypothetical protein